MLEEVSQILGNLAYSIGNLQLVFGEGEIDTFTIFESCNEYFKTWSKVMPVLIQF